MRGISRQARPWDRPRTERARRRPLRGQGALLPLPSAYSPEASLRRATACVVPRMPVLDEALAYVPSDHFREHALIAVQHLYASTVGVIDALVGHGLAPEHATLVGKSYSTSWAAARALVERGVVVPLSQLEQRPTEDHGEVMRQVLRAVLRGYRAELARGRARPRLLALDEGGQLIELLHGEFADLAERVTAVEQTSRGLHKLRALQPLRFGVVTVADTWLKLQEETPLIAESVLFEIERRLTLIALAGMPAPSVVHCLGAGSVGRAVAQLFVTRGFEVVVHDAAPIDAHELGCGVHVERDRERFLRGAKLLVSATGAAPIDVEDYARLPHGAMLFNAASSNDELAGARILRHADTDPEWIEPGSTRIWGLFRGRAVLLGDLSAHAQRDRVLHLGDRDVLLAKAGFVINLTDAEDPIPARYIQVTRGAVAAACVQAVSEHARRDRRQLAHATQLRLLEVFRRELDAEVRHCGAVGARSVSAAPMLWDTPRSQTSRRRE